MHKILFNALFIVLSAPILFVQWLLLNNDFGPGKAVIFVVVFFLFGSAFFFD
jgi:hypothetical protein